jgi:ceramide glucosyltransferase
MTDASTQAALWLCQICTTLALFGCGYALLARALTVRYAKRSDAAQSQRLSATILKPLHGHEVHLAENLASFCRQDFCAPVQIIFGVQSIADPAIPVVHALMTAYPKANIRLVIDHSQHGSNRKISNLINMGRFIENEMVVLADSDTCVEPDYLRRLCGNLEQPGVGIVSCLYRGKYSGTFWSRLACMSMDFHFLPSVIVGLTLKLATPCLGPTIAMRRETLDAIGGFTAFADQLADDYAMGAAVTKLGLRIEIPPFMIAQNCPEQSFDELFRHELRWARTIFGIDKYGFIGLGVTHALPLALLAALFGGFDLRGCALVAFALFCRLWLQSGVARAFGIKDAPLWLAPLRDAISFLVHVACFFTKRVDWRGHRYTITGDGNITPYVLSEKGKSSL